jgi:hypothetical protein
MRKTCVRSGLSSIVATALSLAMLSLPLGAAGPDRSSSGAVKSVAAAGAVRPAVNGSRAAGATLGVRATSVFGTAWESDNTPIKDANLRLRNVVNGKIQALTKGNAAGQFVFENIEPGSYVVELVSDTGKIRALGHVFTISPGETMATFVRLETKVPWGEAFFKNTASILAITAASQGITALSPAPLCKAGAASPPCD